MANKTTTKQTATQLLRHQHEQVKQLFNDMAATSSGSRTEVFDCLRAMLAVHETAEEMIIYPALRLTGDEGQRIAGDRLKEESEAKRMLSDLEKAGPDGADFNQLFETFRMAVLRHAESEEREVFPRLDKHYDAGKLGSMGEAIMAAERLAPTHPHPHGPESAIGNLLVGPFVSMVDKVRDKLKERTTASS